MGSSPHASHEYCRDAGRMLGSYIERDDTDSRGRGERRPSRARIGSVAFVRVGRSSSVRLARVSRATTRDGTGRDGTGRDGTGRGRCPSVRSVCFMGYVCDGGLCVCVCIVGIPNKKQKRMRIVYCGWVVRDEACACVRVTLRLPVRWMDGWMDGWIRRRARERRRRTSSRESTGVFFDARDASPRSFDRRARSVDDSNRESARDDASRWGRG